MKKSAVGVFEHPQSLDAPGEKLKKKKKKQASKLQLQRVKTVGT